MATPVASSIDRNSTTTLLTWAIVAIVVGAVATLFLLDAWRFALSIRLVGPLLMIGLAGASYLCLRLGRLALATDVMAFGICLVASSIALVTGGVRSPVLPIYPVLILMYGWARHDSSGPLMAGVSIACILALWLINIPHFLPGDQARPDSVYALHVLIVCLLSGVSIVFIRKAYWQRLHELDLLDGELANYADLLEQSETRHRTLIEWMPQAILVHRDSHIVYANPAALRLFGAPDLATLMHKRTTDLICPDQLESQLQRMHQIANGEPHPALVQSCFLRLDGTPVPVEVQGTAIEFDGAPAIHVSIRDITEHKRLEEEVRHLAFYDPLTNLPNRRLLDDRLRQTLAASQRSGSYGALLFLDLDNFKPLNDHCGHAVGDQLLIQAAARLKSCVRAKDTIARYGGDEFVVLLPELDTNAVLSAQAALQAADKIRSVMATPYPLHHLCNTQGQPLADHPCTVSVGVVVYTPGHANAPLLLEQADAAMYQAKQTGGNRVVQVPAAVQASGGDDHNT